MPTLPKTKVERSRRKTLALHILPDKTILVKAPWYVTPYEIDRFIEKSWAWIEKRMATMQKTPVIQKQYQTGEQFLYLGKPHTLTIGNHTKIAVENDKLLFPQALLFRVQKELTTWYIKQGQEIITRRVEWYAEQMKAEYKSISFSDTKSKWGSCSHDNRLQFSWRLVMTPLLVLNYVVVHELTHTKEKNHSQDFWTKIRNYNPSYKQQIKWLKTYGHTLKI